MATPESKIKAALDKMLKAEGVWYYSPQAGPYGVAGIPDRVAIVCGLFLGIECKADEKCKMTALQERCKEQIENAGGKFFLVFDKATIEEVRQWIVSTRNRRQEGGSCGVGGSTSDPRYDPDGESCAGETFIGFDPTQPGHHDSLKEFRARRAFSNSTSV